MYAVEPVDPKPHALQPGLEQVRAGLAGVLGDGDGADVEPEVPEDVDQADDVHVVGDAQVAAHLVLLDVVGIDGDDDLRLVLQLQQHADLVVGLKARQHAGGVVVVEQLAAELQIQLAAEKVDAFADAGRLKLNVFPTVKSNPVHNHPPRASEANTIQKSL